MRNRLFYNGFRIVPRYPGWETWRLGGGWFPKLLFLIEIPGCIEPKNTGLKWQ
jgi:hypothetical protein